MTYAIGSRRLHVQQRIGAWLKRPLRHKLRSVSTKGGRLLRWLGDIAFERWYRLDCRGYIRNDEIDTVYSASRLHSKAYQAIPYTLIRSLLYEAEKTGIVFDDFIDIGSGKGKACFYAAVKGRFRNITGVEFSAPLVAVADANKKRFGGCPISFVHLDATLFSLPPGSHIVFLFNPFAELILRKFLDNNIDHFRENRSVIAYANDQHRHCLAAYGFATVFRNQEDKCSLHQYIGTDAATAPACAADATSY